MTHITDRQTFVISINCETFIVNPLTGVGTPSQIQLPMNLRFAADELILKSIVYRNTSATPDIGDVVQIWCNITNDNLIGAFPNSSTAVPMFLSLDHHFTISNTFQTGNFILQLQTTRLGGPASYNPQTLISSLVAQRVYGTVVITLEFVKHSK